MRTKHIMTSIAAPILSKHGFELIYSKSGCFTFENATNKMGIHFECSPLIKEEISNLHDGIDTAKLPSEMSTSYRINLPERHTPLLLTSYQLRSHGDFLYYGKADFEANLKVTLDEYIFTLLPYLNSLIKRYVFPTQEMYDLLSNNPEKRATEFAECYGLSTQVDSASLTKYEKILLELRECADKNYKKTFSDNLNEVVNAIAYLGELIRNYKGPIAWEWGWHTDEDIVTSLKVFKGNTYYCLIFKDIPLDIASDIVNFWNYFPEARCRPFESYFIGKN